MLVLASASPRRQDLLRNAGISFVVEAAGIDEKPVGGESPRDFAERLAREKALAVHWRRPHDFVLGADTIVVVDDVMLGKPHDAADARRMLRMLSGRTHQVITGVCLIKPAVTAKRSGISHDAQKLQDVRSEITTVTMSDLTDYDIDDYIATDEPMDKAGAYAIQGVASRWIPRIEGDYSNVVGLPVSLVYGMACEAGVLRKPLPKAGKIR